ncbi:MAG: hypothetical protein A2096_09525 [Spirochaetes bacterium GWF1_41_5]|nr:MAG: hypothetical protein A2096_09525 [Spirochaetes bacterium GWF1_41_5]
METQLLSDFQNPSAIYRGAPFWAWNGKLEKEELKKQVQIMHKMGLGGFFMHARVGLDTGYLTPEWFSCINTCAEEAEKLGMKAWLYDEDRWPSGAAGGLVTAEKKYRQRMLVFEEHSSKKKFTWKARMLAAFICRGSGINISGVRRLAKNSAPEQLSSGEKIISVSVQIHENSDWFNGAAYLDTLNAEAVREFIRRTHTAYKKNCGNFFNGVIPGIFTDEPNYGHHSPFPWTDCLPDFFYKRFGYSIIENLPELKYNIDGKALSAIRRDYYDCLTCLFTDAFARQIGDWCGRNKLDHTGHVLAEDRMSGQRTQTGSAMRFYEYMQAPGMDLLTEHQRIYDTAKQVVSAARQFGCKWRLSETYGCTGWDFSFEGHKALGDWQAALGINLRCQHLSWYTMQGQAKRDYPASVFYQSPWFAEYKKVEDYFARINLVMTRGIEKRDILLIHPVEGVWMFNPDDSAGMREYDKMLIGIRDHLLSENLDFDYGDEDIISRHAKIIPGKTPCFQIVKASYKVIVVPPMLTIRKSTLELLEKFAACGGKVIFIKPLPDYVNAVKSALAGDIAAKCILSENTRENIAASVSRSGRILSITDAQGKEIAPALFLLREDSSFFYLFIVNTGHTEKQLAGRQLEDILVRDRSQEFPSVTVTGFNDCSGPVYELDPETGKIYKADTGKKDGNINIRTSLLRLGSRLFIVSKKGNSLKTSGAGPVSVKNRKTIDFSSVRFSLSEANVLLLDTPELSINNKNFGRFDILKADRLIRENSGIKPRGGQMIQPWARKKPLQPKYIKTGLLYTFQAETIPSGDIFLAIEEPDSFTIILNGEKIDNSVSGFWTDRSLKKIRIRPNLIKPGENRLILKCEYSENHPGLEIIYLLGNFGVKLKNGNAVLQELPGLIKTGDWVKQGLPFYSGSVTYYGKFSFPENAGKTLFLAVPDYCGTAVRVLVNGENAGLTAWAPNRVDISPFVKKGLNTLGIEIISHRRNSHGPFYCSSKWPNWTGPGEFEKYESRERQLVPCGLMKNPVLEY